MYETTYEKELRRIFDGLDILTDKKFLGNVFYAKIDDELRLKAEFPNAGELGHRYGIALKVLNRIDGQVDTASITFDDILKPHHLNDSYYFKPNIYENKHGLIWNNYCPTDEEMKMVGEWVKEYVSVFQDQTIGQEFDEGMAGMQGM